MNLLRINKKVLLGALVVVTVFLYMQYVYVTNNMYQMNAYMSENYTFKILFWNYYKLNPVDICPDGDGQIPFIKGNCPFQNCLISGDKKDLNKSDVIVINMKHVPLNMSTLPKHRQRRQKWVFRFDEAGNRAFTWMNLSRTNRLFNMTDTYRQDADIYNPYGDIKLISPDDPQPQVDLKNITGAKQKDKVVLWVVSNCESTTNRNQFVKELRKSIKVDIFGVCGRAFPMECRRNYKREAQGTQVSVCMKPMNRMYMFYLALENSFCQDYITEKYWRSLTDNIVPITLGSGNYSKLGAPNSYIDALNFTSTAQLAYYINIVRNNSELYEQYFGWKLNYVVTNYNKLRYDIGFDMYTQYCRLCAALNKNKFVAHKVYRNMQQWINGEHCKRAPKSWKTIKPDLKVNLTRFPESNAQYIDGYTGF